VRRKRLSATAAREEHSIPSMCADMNNYRKKIVDAEWIFSRKKTLLLAATGTTREMPGGMERLTHECEYRTVCRKVKAQGMTQMIPYSVSFNTPTPRGAA